MRALNEIDGVQQRLGNTPISMSSIWGAEIDKILPEHLMAFRTRMDFFGLVREADLAIECALKAIRSEAKLQKIKALNFTKSKESLIDSGEWGDYFEFTTVAMRAAILFGLEMRMQPSDVAVLTWQKAFAMRRKCELSAYANKILATRPTNIASNYVFWHYRYGKPLPLFGIDQEVFDVFGKVWGELQYLYDNIGEQNGVVEW